MPSTAHRISSNHMFAVGCAFFVMSIMLFQVSRDYTTSLILAMIGLSLLMGAAIESIGQRDEVQKHKGNKSVWAVTKIFLNGIMLALLVLLFSLLIYLSLMSGTKALGLLMVVYLVVAAWIIERQMKRHG